jgi:predicted nucleotidyltransferase
MLQILKLQVKDVDLAVALDSWGHFGVNIHDHPALKKPFNAINETRSR